MQDIRNICLACRPHGLARAHIHRYQESRGPKACRAQSTQKSTPTQRTRRTPCTYRTPPKLAQNTGSTHTKHTEPVEHNAISAHRHTEHAQHAQHTARTTHTTHTTQTRARKTRRAHATHAKHKEDEEHAPRTRVTDICFPCLRARFVPHHPLAHHHLGRPKFSLPINVCSSHQCVQLPRNRAG